MATGFPNRLKKLIRQAEKMEQNLFVPFRAGVYACLPISEFNALVEAEILILHTRYRFNVPSSGEWVSPHFLYKSIGFFGEKNETAFHLLSSWSLTDPVGPVPSREELEKATVWRGMLSRQLGKPFDAELMLEKLHESYVAEACKEVIHFERSLYDWRTSGSPLDQEIISFSDENEKKRFRLAIKCQQRNVLQAKRELEELEKTGAPEFLISSAAGKHLRESKILSQMHTALVVCK